MKRDARRKPPRTTPATPDEQTALVKMLDAYLRLRSAGWREAAHAPRDGTPLEVIEPGSTGIHYATRDDAGHFWINDGETMPSTPCLFRIRGASA